jgi:hypothetical protein
VPVEALAEEFRQGATAEQVAARTLRLLWALGARHCYVSNLPVSRARQTLERIVSLARQDD